MANTLGGHAVGVHANDTTTTIATAALSVQPTLGSTLSVWIFWEIDTGGTLSGVTDNASGGSNTYVAGVAQTDLGGGRRGAHYYAKDIQRTIAALVITATFTLGMNSRFITAAEVKGADATAPLDKTALQSQTNPGTAANAVTSGAQVTTTAGQFIHSAMARSGSGDAITQGTGYTLIANDSGGGQFRFGHEYQIQGAGASIAGTWTIDPDAAGTYTGMATFKEAGGGGGGTDGWKVLLH